MDLTGFSIADIYGVERVQLEGIFTESLLAEMLVAEWIPLDELDWEPDRRGHRFARYADDCNILVRSKRAGERVMGGVTRIRLGSPEREGLPSPTAVPTGMDVISRKLPIHRQSDREKHGQRSRTAANNQSDGYKKG